MARANWSHSHTVLGLVVLIHVLLAVASAIPAIHTGGDNAAYVSLAHSLARDAAYAELWSPGSPPHTRYPPLYPGFLALLMLLGAKTWSVLKASSIAFTALATAMCFLWAQRFHAPRTAGLVALLFGLSPAVLFYSHWILAEPLFLALTFGSLWLLTPRLANRKEVRGTAERDSLLSGKALAVGLALAIAANFTRSAGLPLVAAVAVWLAWKRRWVPLGLYVVAFAAVAVPWQLRSGGEYGSAFWLINPYAPDLGVAGLRELSQRVVRNLWEYTTIHMPAGLSGLDGTLAAVLGAGLLAAVVIGWLRRMRRDPGVTEIFFPLYSGLILLWPVQWSGDRFALPLFPLVLLYAGETVLWGVGRFGRRPAWVAAAAAAALIAVPAANSWREQFDMANDCRVRTGTTGPMGCLASNVREFQAMALWARTGLPEGSVVLSRKPRLFYAFSGHPSVTYPFTDDGRTLLTEADSLGIGHVVVGNWDFSGPAYVNPVITANPERFCVMAQLNRDTGSPITLLAITDPEPDDAVGEEAAGGAPGEVQVGICLAEGWDTPPPAAALASMTIPILDRPQ